MYRLIEGFGAESLNLVGKSWPDPSLVEDDDGIRLFLTSDGEVRDHIWSRVHPSGVAMVVRTEPFGVLTTDTFTTQREQVPGGWRGVGWEPCVPGSYVTMVSGIEPSAPLTNFVHLHCHSDHSALDGLSTIDEMVERAVVDNQPALAVTDHYRVAGHPALQIACDGAGIAPIFGVESNWVPDRHVREDRYGYKHLILWAMDNDGLRNLWAMSTEANRTGMYGTPRIDWELLTKFNEGVMCSTACIGGPLGQLILDAKIDEARSTLSRFAQVFKDRLYVEIHTNESPEQRIVNEALVVLAYDHGLPVIAVTDSHYPCLEDHHIHQMWIAVQTSGDMNEKTNLFAGDAHFPMWSRAEVAKLLDYLPVSIVDESINNTVGVANRCSARLVEKRTPPVFTKSKDRDNERLLEMCSSNLDKCQFGRFADELTYLERLENELSLIFELGFAGVYLMTAENTEWARDQGCLIGPGRGSAASSLVSYLCGITALDPVRYGLLFERFMTPGRKNLPDFDIDYPSSWRDRLAEHARDRWGEDCVARVGTVNRHKSRGIVRMLARLMAQTKQEDIFYPDIERICQIIDEAEAHSAGKGVPWDQLWDEHGDALGEFRAKYPTLFMYADRMVGRVSTYSRHAAGVVISIGDTLTDKFPMRKGEGDDELVVEFAQDACEFLGLVKNDFLSLRTLDTIQMCMDLVKDQHGITVNPMDFDEEYDDPLVWEMISDGYTLGIFQVETVLGTRMCKRLKPTNINELADVIALIRPGPRNSGITESYLRRRAGQEPVTVFDPRMEFFLGRTQGLMIYQEQIMQCVQVIAGYSLVEADEVRAMMGKKKTEQVDQEAKRFIPAAVEHGITREDAIALWDQMKAFAAYVFNLPHAISYAIVGHWCAFFKAHFPLQFLVAVLSTVDKDRIPAFIHESRRMGYMIAAPDINESRSGFSATDLVVRYGLDSIKGVGEKAVMEITAGQPYRTFEDFLDRKGKANMGVVETLAKAGAFDSLVANRRSLESHLERIKSGDLERCTYKTDGILNGHGLPCTFDWVSEPIKHGPSGRPMKPKPPPKRCTKACRQYHPPENTGIEEMAPYTDKEIRDREQELLGVYLSSTPFDEIPGDVLAECSTGMDLEAGEEGQYVLAAIVGTIRPKLDRHGNAMAFMSVYAQNVDLDVAVFKGAWSRLKETLEPGQLVLMVLNKTGRGNHLVDARVVATA